VTALPGGLTNQLYLGTLWPPSINVSPQIFPPHIGKELLAIVAKGSIRPNKAPSGEKEVLFPILNEVYGGIVIARLP